MKRDHKYGAVVTLVDGVRFASKREARRYQELRLLEKGGQIRALRLQPRFDLHVLSVSGELIKVGRYTADFGYEEWPAWLPVIEDVKAPPSRTEAYMLRKRMVEAEHGIRIREV